MLVNTRQAPTRLPDLVISNFTAKETNITDRVTLSVEVTNRGNAPSEACQVAVSVEDDDAQKTAQLKALAAGAKVQLSVGPVPLHWNGMSLLTLDATVDSQNQVAESDEGNNWSKLFLTAPSPDPFPPNPWPPVPPIPHP